MMVSDERYRGHQVFSELDEYIDFYRSLSISVMSFATMGTTGIQIISATLMDEWREVANC